MHVGILDPQLNRANGHYAKYDEQVALAFKERGCDVTAYGSVQRLSTFPSALPVEPIFRRDIFSEVSPDALCWGLENFVKLGDDFAEDLGKLKLFQPSDVAFFPNVTQYQIDGIKRWILRLPENSRPNLVINATNLTHAMPYWRGRPNKEIIPLIFRYSMRSLAGIHNRTWFCTDTEKIVAQLRLISEMPVHLLPLPLAYNLNAQSGTHGSRLTVTYLGHASPFKGFHVLPDLIRRLEGDRDRLHFLVQHYGDPAFSASIEKALALMKPEFVTLIRGAVDDERYYELLAKSDIVLLPYEKELYSWASSGIFTEALSLGKVIVVTEGTWASEQLLRFGAGGVVCALNPESLARGIQQATTRFSELKDRAMNAAPAWREFHSPAKLVDKLLSLTQGL